MPSTSSSSFPASSSPTPTTAAGPPCPPSHSSSAASSASIPWSWPAPSSASASSSPAPPPSPPVHASPWWKIALCFLCCLLAIPCAPALDIRGWLDFYPLNCPAWSLAYEYLANILYALLFRHLPKAALAALAAASALLTLDLTLGWDLFGLFPDGPIYSLIGGWYWASPQLYIGAARLLYPFLCGLLLARILRDRSTPANPAGSPLRIPRAFTWTAILLLAILAAPCIGGRTGRPDGLFQAVSVLLLFPLLVLVGVGNRPASPAEAKICNGLGTLSYPLYLVHYPFIYIQISFAESHPDAPPALHFAVSAALVLAAILLAAILAKAYDAPLRRLLAARFLKNAT